mmetsp:Transcript_42254/g.61934  ORF Transcript_42254/g.61934 Transcript_42254/m.61934 type:complete len:184 (+) Transcript_42254:81-632(+)|eukprot:CAMPEP_0195526656 /NCGR_PEP_ID=MMETSP0794_2-20130614/27850_1 /TAXON_ID=515487 /ORGANISM="Stephanopyxis turris, Strain CCMP 815" /LENGTH=183 /DNA_ID=CAMNT_0040657397 /DNA_START=80 /DNA_END=631 /DNA_ORIENTATION=+
MVQMITNLTLASIIALAIGCSNVSAYTCSLNLQKPRTNSPLSRSSMSTSWNTQPNVALSHITYKKRLSLYSSPDDNTDSAPIEEKAPEVQQVSTPAPSEPEGTSYPVNLPSPILLASSMILAIASIGSIFELTGGTPKLGFAITAVIAGLGLPLCLFLFYAAILKGTAETEEDDAKFSKNGRL